MKCLTITGKDIKDFVGLAPVIVDDICKGRIIAGVTVEDLKIYQCYDKYNTVTDESEAFRKELAELVRNSKNVKALETADSYLYA